MKKIFILILIVASFYNCKNDNDTSNVNIRLANISQFNYQNIIVNTSTGAVNFDDLESQQLSAYKTFEKAYSYAFIELQIDGNTYTFQPIDYVGESLLKNGYYTYQIDANESQEQYGTLSLTLIKDY
tara:strand:- start:846 stop:1226 length:381 start_codon:yes stop_codon:yes gene_type:complete